MPNLLVVDSDIQLTERLRAAWQQLHRVQACATEAGCCFQPPKGATGGTIPWSSFTDQCYASGVSAFNPATDGLLRINFQVSSTDTPQPWSFCVTTLEF